MEYKRIKSIAYIPNTVPKKQDLKTGITTIILHNTHTSGLAVTLHYTTSGDATPAAGNRFYNETLAAGETVLLEFYDSKGIVLEDTGDSIKAVCATAEKVTIQAYGWTEYANNE